MPRIALPIVLTLTLLGATARGETPWPWHAGVTETQREAARQAFDAANERAELGLLLPAVTFYERALTHWDHPAIHHNLVRALLTLDRAPEALTHLWHALRYGADGIGGSGSATFLLFQEMLLEERLVHLVVLSEQTGEVRLGDRVLVRGPGRWEGVVRAGPIALTTTGVEGNAFMREVGAGKRLEVVWPARGAPRFTVRGQRESELPDLMRATIGTVVRIPSADERAAAPEPPLGSSDAALAAPLERSAEARALCSQDPSRELARLCKRYDLDLTRLEARLTKEVARWTKTARRNTVLLRAGMIDGLL